MAQMMAARPGASHVPESNSPSVQAQASPHTTQKLLQYSVEHVIVPLPPKQISRLKNPLTTYPVVLVLQKRVSGVLKTRGDYTTTLVAQPQRPPRPRVALRAERRDRRRVRPI